MIEIHPLRLHDLPFAYRLVGHGVSFDIQLSLTVGKDSLRHALLSGTGRTQAYVLRQPGSSGLGQLHYQSDQQYARLAYLAPSLREGASEDLWLWLLDGLTVQAGLRGAVSIIAEVNEDMPELAVLRRAEFVTYARQTLWGRPPAPVEPSGISLHPVSPAEVPVMMGLYDSLVPGLIRHVEPPPAEADRWYVLDGSHGPDGFAAIYEGRSGTLIEIYVSPAAMPVSRGLLNTVLAVARADTRPVYLRMRDYMGCSGVILGDAGFECIAEQVVLARHTAVRVTHQAFRLAAPVDGGATLPTSNLRSG